MDSADNLLGGLASGDTASLPAAVAPVPLKREHDSTDDFEHLERERGPGGAEAEPQPRLATQSFLDMERDIFLDSARAPSAADKLDHLADKFTDSESDADTAGESPLHRPAPRAAPPVDLLAEPVSAPAAEPAPRAPAKLPVEAPAPPAPVAAPAPAPSAPSAAVPEPKAPTPEPPQPAAAPPVAAAEPARAPTAHVIEAEVIFCQMGLGKQFLFLFPS